MGRDCLYHVKCSTKFINCILSFTQQLIQTHELSLWLISFSLEIPEWLQVYAKASPEYDCFLKVRPLCSFFRRVYLPTFLSQMCKIFIFVEFCITMTSKDEMGC